MTDPTPADDASPDLSADAAAAAAASSSGGEPAKPARDEPAADAQAAGRPSETAKPPQMGMLHLFAIVAGCALILGSNQEVQAMRQAGSAFHVVNKILAALVLGPAAAFLFFPLIHRRDAYRFPSQPGHWLGILFGAYALQNVITAQVFSVLGLGYYVTLQSAVAGLLSAACGGLAVLAYADAGDPRHGDVAAASRWTWRLAWGVIALTSFLRAILSLASAVAFGLRSAVIGAALFVGAGLANFFLILYFLIVVVAVLQDLFSQTRRDWLHWVPIVLFPLAVIVLLMVSVVWLIVSVMGA